MLPGMPRFYPVLATDRSSKRRIAGRPLGQARNRTSQEGAGLPFWCRIRPARGTKFIEPDQADASCPVLLAKIFSFPSDPNHLHISHRPVPHEGRLAIVTDAGRDAVDAGSASDEGAGLRTAKSCGPDAPTLASSSREASFLGATVAIKPGHRGEREISC
jgi:hypothetical protein